MNDRKVRRLEDEFNDFYQEYRKFIVDINLDNLDTEELEEMYDQVKGYEDYFNRSEIPVENEIKDKISTMLDNLGDLKQELELKNNNLEEGGKSVGEENNIEAGESSGYSVEMNPLLSHRSQLYSKMQKVINTFLETDSKSGRTFIEKMQDLRSVIDDVKKTPDYKFVKDSNGGSKEEKKAFYMIESLDRRLKAWENSQSRILGLILKRALEGQVKRMKESDDFKIGIMRLKSKNEPHKSAQFKEESIKPNTAELKEMLKRLSYPKEILDFSSSDQGHQNFKQLIEFIKHSDEYEEYKRGVKIDPAFSKAFKAIDECEKLLSRAIKSEKIPVIWKATNGKLKKFLEKNQDVFKVAVDAARENMAAANPECFEIIFNNNGGDYKTIVAAAKKEAGGYATVIESENDCVIKIEDTSIHLSKDGESGTKLEVRSSAGKEDKAFLDAASIVSNLADTSTHQEKSLQDQSPKQDVQEKIEALNAQRDSKLEY